MSRWSQTSEPEKLLSVKPFCLPSVRFPSSGQSLRVPPHRILNLKNIAIGRLFLDNIPHVKTHWPMVTPALSQPMFTNSSVLITVSASAISGAIAANRGGMSLYAFLTAQQVNDGCRTFLGSLETDDIFFARVDSTTRFISRLPPSSPHHV